MAQIENLVATTELEAVNAMLASIGEAPIDDLDVAATTMADVRIAVSILRATARDVQTEGWRFNSEFGLQVENSGSYTRVDTDGTSTVLSIFKPPAGLVKFEMSRSEDQQGDRYTDAVIRPSKEYQESAKPVLVFYDRARNRDGWDATERVYLYIDAVFLFNFEHLPETARNYIVVKASRRFAQRVAGSAELSSFSSNDELTALRGLKRDQGEPDDYNIFDNMDTYKHIGQRPRGPSGVSDTRNSPGPA